MINLLKKGWNALFKSNVYIQLEDKEKYFDEDSFGSVREIYRNWIFIDKNTWMPGVWTGTGGAVIKIKGRKYRIMDIDFNRVGIKVTPIPSQVNVLDKIEPRFYNE